MNDLPTIGGSIIVTLLSVSVFLPKLLNSIKTDGLNGNVLDRLKAMELHASLQDRRAIVQDDKIHRFSMRVTRLMVIVIKLESLLVEHRVDLPQDLIDEILSLKNEEVDEPKQGDKT